ncbi:MAG: beta-ketoacyl-[acyl-carrier-protein] synthase family protein [Myxococcota bacterium]
MNATRSSSRARSEALDIDELGSASRLSVARRPALVLNEVVITGVGAILPNCDTREALWRQLHEGESQLDIELDPVDQIACPIGRVRSFDCARYLEDIKPEHYQACHREQQFYLASLVSACRDAGLSLSELKSSKSGLFDGSSRGAIAALLELSSQPNRRLTLREFNLQTLPGQAVGIAAAILGVKGPTYTFNGTCASGAIAIGNAFRELQAGRINVALGTGHDAALVPPLFQVYRDAQLMSREATDPRSAIKPYSGNSANAFGEGAVTLVMETRQHAERRGAEILAEVVGFRHGNGGEHPTDVDFTGERPAQLIQDVLEEAELAADAIDFVIGHGNGVAVSDISELNYMKRTFGRRTREVPLISTKPIYGHTLGASSALNLAAAALMLRHNYVIPTVGVDESRVVHGFNHQANRGKAKALRTGLVVSYGIGGQNVVLALRRVSP